ncbi:MAG: hypothetical protein WDZ49_12330 [Litorilinea sp.]
MVMARQLLGEPTVQWLTAAPLWQPYHALAEQSLVEQTKVRQPALLRFATDTFMDDFLGLLANAPERLGEWYAIRETWRKPAPNPALPTRAQNAPQAAAVLRGATEDPKLVYGDAPLKLYMPTHGRFYLVTANLVCRIPGLPDKMLDFSNDEQVSFVVRRTVQDQEHAHVNGAWQPVADNALQTLVAGETQHPLFSVTYEEFRGQPRRLLAGLVPVSQRESLLTAPRRPAGESTPDAGALANADAVAAADTEARIDQYVTVADMDVFSAWRGIVRAWQMEDTAIGDSWSELDGDAERVAALVDVITRRDRLQAQTWYVLLDFAYFLHDHLSDVWDVLVANPDDPVGANLPGKPLVDALQAATFQPGALTPVNLTTARQLLTGAGGTTGTTSLAKALSDVYDARNFLETTTADFSPGQSDDWPASRFLLSGESVRGVVNALDDQPDGSPGLIRSALRAIPPDPGKRIPERPLARQISDNMGQDDYAGDQFHIRCVFQRPNCPHGVKPTVVSEPTEPFRMAAYFDPDAPVRPVRIPMPIDTSPAGLRKHARNTMFVLSDTLACQVEKARSLSFGDLVLSVLPWPFKKSLPNISPAGCEGGRMDIGLLCTLSLPIITICALILLIIIVMLLDVIFKWVPYLIFCLPLPGLKAKEQG